MTESPSASAQPSNISNSASNDPGEEAEDKNGGGCNLDKGTPVRRYRDIPGNDRLAFPYGTNMDRLYANTSKPEGLVPEPFMPIWPELPTDTKIPMLPAPPGLFEIGRANVGIGLYRNAPDFTLYDPLNKERVVTSPYTGLHDPNAHDLYTRDLMLTYLKKVNLVSPDGLVRCRTKEFNDYRRYLNKRIYLADLTGTYEKTEKILALQKAQLREIRKDVSKSEGRLFKIEQTKLRAKENQDRKMATLKKRFMLRNAYTEFRAQAHAQMLAEVKTDLLLKSIAKESQMKTRRAAVKEEEEARRKFYMQQILEKERRTSQYRQAEKCRKERERNEMLVDWLSVRCDAQQRQIERKAETKKTVAATLKRSAMKRQMKVDAHRAGMADRIVARRAEENRIMALVRKYFYRWLENVRKRKARRPDEFHRSFWTIQTEVETAVTYLRQESGYEKFDDFIMNIVKLKRDIMAEMESEEQAEAAAALGLLRDEPESDDVTVEPSDDPKKPDGPTDVNAEPDAGQESTVATPSATATEASVALSTETPEPAAPASGENEQ